MIHVFLKKCWTLLLVQNAYDGLQFFCFHLRLPSLNLIACDQLSMVKPWLIASNYVLQMQLVLFKHGQIFLTNPNSILRFLVLNSWGTQREVIFFSLRWSWIILYNVPRLIHVSASNWSKVIYGSCSIVLLTRSIFGGNVSTFGRTRDARSSISCLPYLNDLHQ